MAPLTRFMEPLEGRQANAASWMALSPFADGTPTDGGW